MPGHDPYRQRVGLEFARIGIMLGASLAVGFLVGVAAAASGSVTADGGFDARAIFVGAVYGVSWGALAIAPLWHRPMLPAWLATGGACVAVGGVLGLLGAPVGAAAGVGAMPFVALVVKGRLPFVFPRHPPGHCPACGYELHRLRSRRCPECGVDVLARPMTPPTTPPLESSDASPSR